MPVVDATMAGEFAGRPRHLMVGEIGWSADDGHPDVRPDADRDHVLFDDGSCFRLMCGRSRPWWSATNGKLAAQKRLRGVAL